MKSHIFLLALAFATSAAAQDELIIDNTVAAPKDLENDIGEKPPMTVSMWTALTKQGQSAYVRATIEGLRWSPRFSGCEQLTDGALMDGIQYQISVSKADGPLLMHIAAAAQDICF